VGPVFELIATLGEVIVLLLASVITLVVAVRRCRLRGRVAMAVAFICAVPIIVLSQSPWDAKHIVGERKVGATTYALTQWNDGGVQVTSFWFNDGKGMWRAYPIDSDNVYWRTVGFHAVASNRVEITRFGIVVGSFDPITRQYCPRDGEPFYAQTMQPVFPF
jgi:hypothetical protein